MFVRVKLPNGTQTTVTADHAEVCGLPVLKKPAVNAAGVPLPPKPPTTSRATPPRPAGESNNNSEESE